MPVLAPNASPRNEGGRNAFRQTRLDLGRLLSADRSRRLAVSRRGHAACGEGAHRRETVPETRLQRMSVCALDHRWPLVHERAFGPRLTGYPRRLWKATGSVLLATNRSPLTRRLSSSKTMTRTGRCQPSKASNPRPHALTTETALRWSGATPRPQTRASATRGGPADHPLWENRDDVHGSDPHRGPRPSGARRPRRRSRVDKKETQQRRPLTVAKGARSGRCRYQR
jgi:hypothetical protein